MRLLFVFSCSAYCVVRDFCDGRARLVVYSEKFLDSCERNAEVERCCALQFREVYAHYVAIHI